MRKLSKLLYILCALLSVCCISAYGQEKFYITAEQLLELEENFSEQRKLLNEQKAEIINLQNCLEEAQRSLRESESRRLRTDIIIGGISFGAGVSVSALIWMLSR